MSENTTLVWLRNDLRLADHPALHAAKDGGGPIVPVFIWDPDSAGSWSPGSASRWWLHQSLRALGRDLEACGSRLILRVGPTERTLLELARETRARAIFWNRRYEPAWVQRDTRIKSILRADGYQVESFNASLLFEPWQVQTKQGKPFQVFTPFWNACRLSTPPGLPLAPAPSLQAPSHWPKSVELSSLGLEPTLDWASEMREAWTPGEEGARKQLERFVAQGLEGYAKNRDRPDQVGTSRLSPHLHFGEISPRTIWHRVLQVAGHVSTKGKLPADVEVYLKELTWREFAYHLLYHFPHTTDQPLRSEFASFPWRDNPKGLRAWQKGKTGYPFVDAGMRELWSTGWMHNRVRMVVASFLVKDLLLPWQVGARWFWDTLVDADLANNTLGWQWTAGCGADAAPYFRIFNPVSQGEKFDPTGEYVRRWVPELRQLPDRYIHKPWDADPAILRAAGVQLGQNYPYPIVDHTSARVEALQALSTLSKRTT